MLVSQLAGYKFFSLFQGLTMCGFPGNVDTNLRWSRRPLALAALRLKLLPIAAAMVGFDGSDGVKGPKGLSETVTSDSFQIELQCPSKMYPGNF